MYIELGYKALSLNNKVKSAFVRLFSRVDNYKIYNNLKIAPSAGESEIRAA
jgi:hypothetical protein